MFQYLFIMEEAPSLFSGKALEGIGGTHDILNINKGIHYRPELDPYGKPKENIANIANYFTTTTLCDLTFHQALNQILQGSQQLYYLPYLDRLE